MPNLLRHCSILIIMIALSLQVACTSMKFTKVWVDETHSGPPYHKVLVIGVADTMGNREDFENYFVKQLKASGIDALVSYKILPDTTKINRDSVLAAISGLGFDCAIVTHLAGIEAEESPIQPKKVGVVTSYGYGPGSYNYQMYDYYQYASNYVTHTDYYTNRDTVSLVTNLYDIATEKLVWSGKSAQFAPDSVDDVVVELTQLVIADLKQKKLLQ